MDWYTCCRKGIVKQTSPDKQKITAMRRIALKKAEGAATLSTRHYYARITLLYDSLRILLEIIALQHGYKVYNHECYTSFLKEILKESRLGDEYDKIRLVRNGINYYGEELSLEEGEAVTKSIGELINDIHNQ